MRKGRCVKARGRHDSSQTQKSSCVLLDKENQPVHLSVAHPWLSTGCAGTSCWSLHPPLQHKFTGLVGAAAPPPSPHPGWWAGALPTPAETPCLFLKVSWGFQSFSSKGHYSQGGVGTLRILVPHVFKFFSITHSIRHLPLTCTYF